MTGGPWCPKAPPNPPAQLRPERRDSGSWGLLPLPASKSVCSRGKVSRGSLRLRAAQGSFRLSQLPGESTARVGSAQGWVATGTCPLPPSHHWAAGQPPRRRGGAYGLTDARPRGRASSSRGRARSGGLRGGPGPLWSLDARAVQPEKAVLDRSKRGASLRFPFPPGTNLVSSWTNLV